MRYFRIRSWHIVDLDANVTPAKAYCGQRIRHTSEVTNDLPGNERSCESCLRFERARRDRND